MHTWKTWVPPVSHLLLELLNTESLRFYSLLEENHGVGDMRVHESDFLFLLWWIVCSLEFVHFIWVT